MVAMYRLRLFIILNIVYWPIFVILVLVVDMITQISDRKEVDNDCIILACSLSYSDAQSFLNHFLPNTFFLLKSFT